MAQRAKMNFRWLFSPGSWLFGIQFIQFPWWGSVHVGPVELCWSRLKQYVS